MFKRQQLTVEQVISNVRWSVTYLLFCDTTVRSFERRSRKEAGSLGGGAAEMLNYLFLLLSRKRLVNVIFNVKIQDLGNNLNDKLQADKAGSVSPASQQRTSRCFCKSNKFTASPRRLLFKSKLNFCLTSHVFLKQKCTWSSCDFLHSLIRQMKLWGSRMHPVHWFLALLLAAEASELSYAGPLHAQCKVEW